jgi:hypothetical protein
VSNNTAHATWTGRAACHCNGHAHVLSVINAKTRVAQRLYARLRPLAYAACSRPRGSIGSPPGRGAWVYKMVRIPPDQVWTRVDTGPSPGSCLRPGYALFWNPGTPLWAARTPHRGSGSHSRGTVRTRGGRRSWTKLGGPDRVYRGPTLSHGGPDSLVTP